LLWQVLFDDGTCVFVICKHTHTKREREREREKKKKKKKKKKKRKKEEDMCNYFPLLLSDNELLGVNTSCYIIIFEFDLLINGR
jgi:hypothetical protein